MGFKIGIVGLPNVGKSTLFNALSEAKAESANFPFCTIEPNVGMVPVPDHRLQKLSTVYQSEKVLPTMLSFVDIAGLVKGASQGEGLGNQFLSHIREVHTIAHVVRCFDDPNIVHVDGSVDPVRDVGVVETELVLRDLETVEKRIARTSKQTKAAGKAGEAARAEMAVLEEAQKHLSEGSTARTLAAKLGDDGRQILDELCLLTQKPVMYIANIAEDDVADPLAVQAVQALKAYADEQHAPLVTISAAIEAEVAQMPEEERADYLEAVGLEQAGLDRIIQEGYKLLGLITYLTAGPKETRAWTIPQGALAPQAAGVIHTDFERGFIRAEVAHWEDLVALGSEAAVKKAGKMRSEGKEYEVVDGDVMHFLFNV